MDSELFKLCKEVYRYTLWETDTRVVNLRGEHRLFTESEWAALPARFIDSYFLYTSDHLLGKLPEYLERETRAARIASTGERIQLTLQVRHIQGEWEADYYIGDYQEYGSILEDTPLKALLKLTLALHEAGELK